MRLRPVLPGDHLELYELSLGPSALTTFRHRGKTPSFAQFEELLWSGVLAQFVVSPDEGDAVEGLVAATDANFADGHASLTVAVSERMQRSGAGIDATALFVDYIFHCFDLHKLYAAVLEFNFQQFASARRRSVLDVEARLPEHDYLGGRYWDLLILALYRETWRQTSAPMVDRLARQAG